MLGLVSATTILKMTYETHSWLPGIVAIVIQVTATSLAFRSLRVEYLRIRQNSEKSEIKSFNRQAVGYQEFNAAALLMWTLAAGWLLGWFRP